MPIVGDMAKLDSLSVKIPFLISIPAEFKPRTHLGSDPALTANQKQLLDAIDILEQKADLSLTVGAKAHNMGLLLCAVLLLTQGTAILGLVQEWLKK